MPKWKWNGKAPVDLDCRRVYPGEQIEVSEMVSVHLRVVREPFWEEFIPKKPAKKKKEPPKPKEDGGKVRHAQSSRDK